MGHRSERRSAWAVLAVVAALVALTVYETAVALGAIDIGPLPGEGAPGGEVVGVAAAVGLLTAALLAVGLAAARKPAPLLSALLAPAAAASLVAHFYTFDPYYAPSLIRYSEREFIPPLVVLALAGLAIGAGLLTRVRPSIGLRLSAALILLCAGTAWVAGAGD